MFDDIEPRPDMAWLSSRISSSSMRSNSSPDCFGPMDSINMPAFIGPVSER